MSAASNGQLDTVKMLLNLGADAKVQNWVLPLGFQLSKWPMFIIFCQGGTTALHLACAGGFTAIARQLISHGADPNIYSHQVCMYLT